MTSFGHFAPVVVWSTTDGAADSMRVFVFEFVTGGGFLELPDRPLPSGTLLCEGQAMWRAIYDDFVRIDGVEVTSLRDGRIPADDLPGVETFAADDSLSLSNALQRYAERSDFALLIAPEFDGHLLRTTELFEAHDCRLLSPNSEFVRIASDKSYTADCLNERNIKVPHGTRLAPRERPDPDFPLPAVLKRNDGAGSMCERCNEIPRRIQDHVMRIEQLVNGLACSVGFLCQFDAQPIACPAMTQILTNDGKFAYLGGKRLMDTELVARATRLGSAAINALPNSVGYVGVDMVLGDATDGSDDFVIEVNPRLTTSYIGIRQLAEQNLATAMVSALSGQSRQHLSFSDQSVEFKPDGTIL